MHHPRSYSIPQAGFTLGRVSLSSLLSIHTKIDRKYERKSVFPHGSGHFIFLILMRSLSDFIMLGEFKKASAVFACGYKIQRYKNFIGNSIIHCSIAFTTPVTDYKRTCK